MSESLVYIRVSTGKQDVQNQRHKILEYGNWQGTRIDEFVEVTLYSLHSNRKRCME